MAGGFDPEIDFALAQLFRSECSRCGDRVLRWFTGTEAVGVLGVAVTAELLDALPRAVAREAQCWQCTRCGECGAFGPAEWP